MQIKGLLMYFPDAAKLACRTGKLPDQRHSVANISCRKDTGDYHDPGRSCKKPKANLRGKGNTELTAILEESAAATINTCQSRLSGLIFPSCLSTGKLPDFDSCLDLRTARESISKRRRSPFHQTRACGGVALQWPIIAHPAACRG